MGFLEAVKHVFSNYANFSGRARRSEYWYFALFNFLVTAVSSGLSMVITIAGLANDGNAPALVAFAAIVPLALSVYGLVTIIPSLAVCCRRLHDVDKPGSYMLFVLLPIVGGILLLVWCLQDSTPGDNRYGPYPKGKAPQYAPAYSPAQPAPVRQPIQSAPVYPVASPAPAYPAADRTIQPSPMQTMPVRQVPQQGNCILQGVNGALRGQIFRVSGNVKIGRNADCGICFPADTDGVSRYHCELASSGGKLYIRDSGSRYGTFINNTNRRLAPGQVVALNAGDCILVGSSRQALRVMRL